MYQVWGWAFHACSWCPKLPRVSNGLKWNPIWSSRWPCALFCSYYGLKIQSLKEKYRGPIHGLKRKIKLHYYLQTNQWPKLISSAEFLLDSSGLWPCGWAFIKGSSITRSLCFLVSNKFLLAFLSISRSINGSEEIVLHSTLHTRTHKNLEPQVSSK